MGRVDKEQGEVEDVPVRRWFLILHELCFAHDSLTLKSDQRQMVCP
jgi:hypothetical protein